METATQTSTPASPPGEEVERVELRPGLVMIRRKTFKPDGRYLLYYDFERTPTDPTEEPA